MDKRVKYSIKQKRSTVRSVLSGEVSMRGAARELGCQKSAVQRWIAQYKLHGMKGFKMRNGHYDAAFKVQVVRYYFRKGLSLSQTATYFKIPNEGIICQWVKMYEQLGAKGLSQKTRGRKKSMMTKKARGKEITSLDPTAQRLEELQKEVEYLRAENAFLKKLEALAQQEQAAKAQARRQKPSGN